MVPLAITFQDQPEERSILLRMVPRDAMLALLAPSVASKIPMRSGEAPPLRRVAFSRRGCALSQSMPIGLMLDAARLSATCELPFCIEAACSAISVDDGGWEEELNSARSALFSRMKEAAFLSCGSAAGVQGLGRSESDALWQGLIGLTERGESESSTAARGQQALHAAQQGIGVSHRVPVRLCLYKAATSDAGELELAATSSHSAAADCTLRAFVSGAVCEEEEKVERSVRLVVQGVLSPPWETPLRILHRRCASYEGWLVLSACVL